MTYGYMRVYEDRVRRAVNTPDLNGHYALWQGGMEANIPVGTAAAVDAAMQRAVSGGGASRSRAPREVGGSLEDGACQWPVWQEVGDDNQLGRPFPPLTYTAQDATALRTLEDRPGPVRGARDLISVGLQYGNAFGRGFEAAALKPADFFGDDGVLYLMEDAATGEIRLSVLWEWLHKAAAFTDDDAESGVKAGEPLRVSCSRNYWRKSTPSSYACRQQRRARRRKATTLPIARAIVEAYVLEPLKAPWYIFILNLNLNVTDLSVAEERVRRFLDVFGQDGTRITRNLDFDSEN